MVPRLLVPAAVLTLAAVLLLAPAAHAQNGDPPMPTTPTTPVVDQAAVVSAVNALRAEVAGLRAEALGRGTVIEGLRAETGRNGKRLVIVAELVGLLVVFVAAGWCVRVFTRPGGVP